MTYFNWISELEYLLKEDMKLFLHDIFEIHELESSGHAHHVLKILVYTNVAASNQTRIHKRPPARRHQACCDHHPVGIRIPTGTAADQVSPPIPNFDAL